MSNLDELVNLVICPFCKAHNHPCVTSTGKIAKFPHLERVTPVYRAYEEGMDDERNYRHGHNYVVKARDGDQGDSDVIGVFNEKASAFRLAWLLTHRHKECATLVGDAAFQAYADEHFKGVLPPHFKSENAKYFIDTSTNEFSYLAVPGADVKEFRCTVRCSAQDGSQDPNLSATHPAH